MPFMEFGANKVLNKSLKNKLFYFETDLKNRSKLGFEPIQLDEATYYMSVVPIHLKLIHLFLLNLGALIVCWSVLIIPSYLITKIAPIKAIRFE